MINLSKITHTELSEIKVIVQRAVEKSEFEKYYLFSTKIEEKAIIFIFCHRLLINIHNICSDGELKKEIKTTIDNIEKRAHRLDYLLKEIENDISYGYDKIKEEIFKLVNEDDSVNDVIDFFSILLEKVSVINISKLKGFLLEGKSKEEYSKVFKKPEI